jgi:hypothetical protein
MIESAFAIVCILAKNSIEIEIIDFFEKLSEKNQSIDHGWAKSFSRGKKNIQKMTLSTYITLCLKRPGMNNHMLRHKEKNEEKL